MNFYVVTPTDTLSYTDPQELSAVDVVKRTVRGVREAAVQAWLENNPGTVFSTLAGGKLIAFNAVRAALRTAGRAEVLTHVVQRGSVAGVPIQIALAAATYICSWDGRAPNVTTLFGTFPAAGISMMGWPQTDVVPDPP